MGWIGVDLDGTLAHYDGWQGVENIGGPIEVMVNRVQRWIENGWEVKIVTARVAYDDPDGARPHIKEWLEQVGLPDLQITNVKDYGMIVLWDDRCVTVEKNTGRILTAGAAELF